MPKHPLQCYIDYETIVKQRALESHLEMHLSEIPLNKTLCFFGNLAARMHNGSEDLVDLQKNVVKALSQDNLFAQRTLDAITDETRLITPEQLVVLIKFSILYCPNIEERDGLNANERLLKILLLFNSFKGDEYPEKTQGFESKAQVFSKVELRGMFNNMRGSTALIGLYHDFFKWAETEVASKSTYYCDVLNDFKKMHKLSYSEYLTAAWVFLVNFLQANGEPKNNSCKVFLPFNEYLFNLNEEGNSIVKNWMSKNSMNIVEAKEAFSRDTPAPYSGASLLPLMSKPLIEVAEGVVFCPHIPYLVNKMEEGLFFSLLDYYNETEGTAKSNTFTQFFAEFLELYLFEEAKDSCQSSSLDGCHVFRELEYRSKNKKVKSTDLVIFEGDSAVFIEVTTARINLDRSILQLDNDSIENDIDRLVKKADQLGRRILDFSNNELQYPEIKASAVKKIYPLVLIPKGVPRFYGINTRIYAKIKEKGILAKTEQLDIVCIGDFDVLMKGVKAGQSVSGFLEKKYSNQYEGVRKMSVRDFALQYNKPYLDLIKRCNNDVPRTDKWKETAGSVIASWGLG